MIFSVMFISAGLLSLLAAWLIYVQMRSSAQPTHVQQRNVNLLVGGSIACTLIAILEHGFIASNGLVLTLATVLGFTVFVIQNLFLLGMRRHGIQGLGVLLLPVVAIVLFGLSGVHENESSRWIKAQSFLETGHLLLSVVAYAILTMAAFYATMQLQLNNALKNKKLGFFVQAMPSLADLSSYLFFHVRWATWLLAFSILSGLAWQWIELQHFALLNHKVLLATFAWVILFLLNQMYNKAAWHHTFASKMVLLAYFLLVFAYFGVALIHDFLNA